MPQICSVTVVSQMLPSYNKVYVEQRTLYCQHVSKLVVRGMQVGALHSPGATH